MLIQDILCSMPNLEIFRSDCCFRDLDMDKKENGEDSRPWVCYKLRELKVAFSIVNPSHQKMVLDRISKLVRLEKLVFLSPGTGHYYPGDGAGGGGARRGGSIRVTLQKGLD